MWRTINTVYSCIFYNSLCLSQYSISNIYLKSFFSDHQQVGIVLQKDLT